MRSTVSIDVRSAPETVFALAREVERWPRLLPHYVAVTVLERGTDGSVTARMVARRPVIPVLGLDLPIAWRSRVRVDDDDLGLHFRHLGGATAGMAVTWRIERTATGCRVGIEHEFRPRIGAWAWIVDRLFVRPIARRTLASFGAIAEAVTDSVGDSTPGPRSDRAAATNPDS